MAKLDGNPSKTWELLVKLGELNGIIRERINFSEKGVKKQKSLLCQKLRDYFGIDEEPIYWDQKLRWYKTRFKICYKD